MGPLADIYGNGNGNGYGDGGGNGGGNGNGGGYGNGDGNGNGYGNGNGNSNGGDGYGDGDGYGNGSSGGDGDGCSNGYGAYIEPFDPIKAYYCAPPDMLLPREHAGQRPKLEPGLVLIWDAPVRFCSAGLHASLAPKDARGFRPDGVMTEVLCSGLVRLASNKLVSQRREMVRVIEREEEEAIDRGKR